MKSYIQQVSKSFRHIELEILKVQNVKYEFSHTTKDSLVNESEIVAWYYSTNSTNSTKPYLQAIEIVEAAQSLALVHSGVSIIMTTKKFSKLPRLYFPIQHPCMPLHFEKMFVWWLQELNQMHPIMPRSYHMVLIQHKLNRWADYIQYKEIWKHNCKILEKSKSAKVGGRGEKLYSLPKELRIRIYAMVLFDENPTNIPDIRFGAPFHSLFSMPTRIESRRNPSIWGPFSFSFQYAYPY